MSKHTVSTLYFMNLEQGPDNAWVLLVCEPAVDYDLKESWMWQLPGGKCCRKKYLNENCCTEKPEETSIREFREETGLQIIHQRLCWIDELANPESREKYKRFVYLAEKTEGTMREIENPAGSKTPQWFKLTAVPRNLFNSHQNIIRIFFRRELLKKPLRK